MREFAKGDGYESAPLTSTTRGVGCLGGTVGGIFTLVVLDEVVTAGGTTLDLSRLRAPF